MGDIGIGHEAKHRGGGRLAVGIHDENAIPSQRQVVCEVHTRRALPYPTFEVLTGNDHRFIATRIAPRARAEVSAEGIHFCECVPHAPIGPRTPWRRGNPNIGFRPDERGAITSHHRSGFRRREQALQGFSLVRLGTELVHLLEEILAAREYALQLVNRPHRWHTDLPRKAPCTDFRRKLTEIRAWSHRNFAMGAQTVVP